MELTILMHGSREIARACHARVVDAPVRGYRAALRTHLRTWHDGWRHLRFILLYGPRWLFPYPGAGLAIAGTLLIALLPRGPLPGGRVVLYVDTMLFAAAAVLIGAQAFIFAVQAETDAINGRLLPPDERMDRLRRHLTLESGLLGSAMHFAIGLALAIRVVLVWARADFGPLDIEVSVRLVIPSVILLAPGVQGAFINFFLSLLGRRRSPADVSRTP